MTIQPQVYIIILNWNGWNDTIDCVESCLKLTYPNYRILLVDNGSTDGSEAILRGRFPDIEFLQTGANLGFAGGNNVGIRFALEKGADYIWLLNNDAVAAREALGELVTAAENDQKAAIFGSKIYYYDEPEKIWFAGGNWLKNQVFTRHRGGNEVDSGQYEEICEVGFVTGCSLMFKTAMVASTGLLKEDYFLYWEDVDWCIDARNQGWVNLFVPASKVWHKVSASTINFSYLQSYYYARGGLLFFQRHAPANRVRFTATLLVDALYALLCLNQKGLVMGYAVGIKDYFLARFGRKM